MATYWKESMRVPHPTSPVRLRNRVVPGLALGLIISVAAAVGAGLVISNIWVVLGSLGTVAALVFMLSSPRAFVLIAFVAKPLIDMLWFAKVDLAGIDLNAASIISVALSFVALVMIFIRRTDLPGSLALPMLVVLFTNTLSLILSPNLGQGLEYWFRVVGSFM